MSALLNRKPLQDDEEVGSTPLSASYRDTVDRLVRDLAARPQVVPVRREESIGTDRRSPERVAFDRANQPSPFTSGETVATDPPWDYVPSGVGRKALTKTAEIVSTALPATITATAAGRGFRDWAVRTLPQRMVAHMSKPADELVAKGYPGTYGFDVRELGGHLSNLRSGNMAAQGKVGTLGNTVPGPGRRSMDIGLDSQVAEILSDPQRLAKLKAVNHESWLRHVTVPFHEPAHAIATRAGETGMSVGYSLPPRGHALAQFEAYVRGTSPTRKAPARLKTYFDQRKAVAMAEGDPEPWAHTKALQETLIQRQAELRAVRAGYATAADIGEDVVLRPERTAPVTPSTAPLRPGEPPANFQEHRLRLRGRR